MLIRRQPKGTLVNLCKLLKTLLELLAWFVLDSTVLDEHGEMVTSVRSSIPPKVVDVAVKGEWTGRFESISKELLNFQLVVVESHSINCVL